MQLLEGDIPAGRNFIYNFIIAVFSVMLSPVVWSALFIRVNCLHSYAIQPANPAGQSTDNILWCVNRHTDDIHVLFLVWDTHAPNNEAAVLMQQMIKLLNRIRISTIMPIRAILVSMRYSLYLVFNMNKALCSLKKGALRRKYTLNLKMFFLLIRESTIICSQYLVSVTLNYDIRAFNVCRLEERELLSACLASCVLSNI